jgi:hypothetical protein
VRRIPDAILRLWEWEPGQGFGKHLLFLLPAAVLCGAAAYVGAVRTHTCGHDIFVFLDGAWRVLSGQRPYADFYSPLGPLTYVVTAAGLALAGLNAEGIGYGAALFAAVTGTWGYRLALARMRPAPAALSGIFLVLLSCTPAPLGTGPSSLSHAMLYNRFGFALLALILVEVLGEPIRARGRTPVQWLGGLSTGVASVLLLFLKPSYFLVAVVLILAFAPTRRRGRRGWLGLAVGTSAALLAALAYIGFDVGAFLADQSIVAAVRAGRVVAPETLAVAWRSQGDLLLMLLIAFFCTSWRGGGVRLRFPAEWKWLAAAVAVFGAGVLLMRTNAQDGGFPLSVVLVMLMVGTMGEAGVSHPAEQGEGVRLGRAGCALGALLLLGANASLDAASLGWAVYEKIRPPQGTLAFLPAHLSGLLLYDLGGPTYPLAYTNGPRYVRVVNDGIRLLRAQSDRGESVATLAPVNPFSFGLLMPPSPGGATVLTYGSEFDEQHRPEARRLFGQADIVMVPKRNLSLPEAYEASLRIYLPEVQKMFTLAAESPDWWLYRRERK